MVNSPKETKAEKPFDKTQLEDKIKELEKENETLTQTLVHYTEELRFVLGIALQARPESQIVQAMVKELYKVEG